MDFMAFKRSRVRILFTPTRLTTKRSFLSQKLSQKNPWPAATGQGLLQADLSALLGVSKGHSFERVRSCLVAIRNRGSARLGVRIT